MLVRTSDVIGTKIVSVKEGKKIDTVDDVIYDPKDNRIKALLVSEGGLFASAKILMIEDVKSVGEDAVVIESEHSIKDAKEVPENVSQIAKESTNLTETKIITETGNELGKVTDLLFDPQSGEVAEFEVSQGGLKDVREGKKRIRISDIITIGEDATIVKGATEKKVESQTGGLTEAASTGADRLREGSSDLLHQAKIGLQDASDRAQDRVSDYREEHKTDESLDHAKTRTQSTLTDLSEKIKAKVSHLTHDFEDRRREDVVGKYLTKNILSREDQLIARKGQIITHELLLQAESNGIVDQVLTNVSDSPEFE